MVLFVNVSKKNQPGEYLMIRSLLINSVILLILIGCHKKMSSEKQVRDGIELLYGKINKEQLYFDYPEWKLVEDTYRPDSTIMKELQNKAQQVDIIVFLGTWCSDSEIQVPAFFKILDDLGIETSERLSIWAVDRKKQLDHSLPETYNINRVPTFIIEAGGQEIGRIVESPESSLEQDLLRILSKNE
jgi:hypothetical protein